MDLFDDLTALKDKQRVRDELTERQLKAIADTMRFRSCEASPAKSSMYSSWQAEALGLTAATLSHHFGQLLGVMLVGIRSEGRRNHYHLNKRELSALASDLDRLAGSIGESL